jgi:hypothetical protein
VGPLLIIVAAPGFDLFLSILQAQKPVLIQAFLPKAAVERFDKSIVCGLPRPREIQVDAAPTRSTDALLRRKNKRRLIIGLDSIEDPVHGKQEGVVYNGNFGNNCFYPLFCFTRDADGSGPG